MKRIDTTQIVSPTSKQPFTGRSLAFLQDYDVEDKAAIIKALITTNLGSYSLTTGYIISGCVLSDSNKDITAGEIFYGGNFYEVTAVNGTTNPCCLVLTKTQDATADPLIFSDSVSKTVHNIFKFVATDATVGTHEGVNDILGTDLVSAYGAGKITFTRDAYTGTAIATQNTSSTTYVDLTNATYTTPNDGVTRDWKITGKSCIGFNNSVTETGGSLSIYCGSNVDESRFIVASTATYISNSQGTVVCQKILTSIAPNTVIKLQIKAATAGATSFDLNSFIVEEL